MISDNSKETIGILAGIIHAGTMIPYLIHLLRGKSHPSVASWLIWSLLGIASLLAYFQQDKQQEAMWVPVLCAVNPTIIFVCLLFVGEYRRLDGVDKWCLSAAVISATLLICNPESSSALWAAIIGDVGAVVAAVRGIRETPRSEPFLPWAIFAFATVLNLVAANYTSVGSAISPIYIAVAAIWITLEIRIAQNKQKLQQALQPSG